MVQIVQCAGNNLDIQILRRLVYNKYSKKNLETKLNNKNSDNITQHVVKNLHHLQLKKK